MTQMISAYLSHGENTLHIKYSCMESLSSILHVFDIWFGESSCWLYIELLYVPNGYHYLIMIDKAINYKKPLGFISNSTVISLWSKSKFESQERNFCVAHSNVCTQFSLISYDAYCDCMDIYIRDWGPFHKINLIEYDIPFTTTMIKLEPRRFLELTKETPYLPCTE